MQRKRTAEVFAAIEAGLKPYVGAAMASTAAEAHCHHLGIAGPALDSQQIGLLLGKLDRGLVILLGEAKTKSVIEATRQAIDALEGVP